MSGAGESGAPDRKQPVAVVGAGLIGRAWAIVFARAGHPVALWDAAEGACERCLAVMRENVSDLRHYRLIDESAEAVCARVRIAPTLADALSGAVLAQENIRETLEAKLSIFEEMDRLAAPETILASSTSSFPASAFTERLAARARCVVAHPVNPPYLVPLVELSPAPWTDPEVVGRLRALYESVGQVPVTLRREIEGFILNRLQGAVLDEAFSLYAQGYMSAEDIDRVMKDGLSLRWSFMGPFETIDLNAPGGLADYADRYGHVYRRIAAGRAGFDWGAEVVARAHEDRRSSVPESQLRERAAWRDRRLMEIVAHRRASRGR